MTETDTIWVASAGKTSPTQGRITVTPAPRTRLRENLSRTMTIMRFMGAYLVRVVVGKGSSSHVPPVSVPSLASCFSFSPRPFSR